MVDINKEGEVLNSILTRRMKLNKNLIGAVTGETGSGKSLFCLRTAQLWYQRRFKKDFPIENCCFSIEELMRRLVVGGLVKGDLLILEEAGTSMSHLDFQNRVSKMFNFILQTFRSRNIIILMNLPYISMLNKTTRMLIHYKFEMRTIDPAKKVAYVKILQLQVNQMSGKIYYHFPKVLVNGSYELIQSVGYHLPTTELKNNYENKKSAFVNDLSADVLNSIQQIRNKEDLKQNPKPLTEIQAQVWNIIKENPKTYGTTELSKLVGRLPEAVSASLRFMRKKGYNVDELLKKRDNKLIKITRPLPLLNKTLNPPQTT